MAIDLNTNTLNWRARLRANEVFIALASVAWQRTPFHQRQLAYARQLGKPVYFLVPAGTQAPAARADEHLYYFSRVEDMARLIQEIVDGDR